MKYTKRHMELWDKFLRQDGSCKGVACSECPMKLLDPHPGCSSEAILREAKWAKSFEKPKEGLEWWELVKWHDKHLEERKRRAYQKYKKTCKTLP